MQIYSMCQFWWHIYAIHHDILSQTGRLHAYSILVIRTWLLPTGSIHFDLYLVEHMLVPVLGLFHGHSGFRTLEGGDSIFIKSHSIYIVLLDNLLTLFFFHKSLLRACLLTEVIVQGLIKQRP